jgi:CheY-like chemotaxis protein
MFLFLWLKAIPPIRSFTSEAFKAAGLTSGFTSVSSGEDAMNYVQKQGKYANVSTPDVVFIDLSLPDVTGLEVLKARQSCRFMLSPLECYNQRTFSRKSI